MPTTRKTSNGSAPELSPPGAGSTAGSTTGSTMTPTAPTRVEPADDLSLVPATAADTAGPTLAPPQREAAAGARIASTTDGVTTAVWQYGKTVSATWSINEERNAWVLVDGVGWKKIFNGTDGAFTALTTLAAQARQTGHQISFREDGGMIYEVYLW
jgi:hypothetical protein